MHNDSADLFVHPSRNYNTKSHEFKRANKNKKRIGHYGIRCIYLALNTHISSHITHLITGKDLKTQYKFQISTEEDKLYEELYYKYTYCNDNNNEMINIIENDEIKTSFATPQIVCKSPSICNYINALNIGNISMNSMYHSNSNLLTNTNIPELLCGWCTQMLDNKSEVQKTAVELMSNIFHECLENGNPQITIGHVEEILDNLFKVLDDQKCARNHPVDDVIAMKDPGMTYTQIRI